MKHNFLAGWWWYWGVFLQPWGVVAGFAAAMLVSNVFYELLKAVVKLLFWRNA